MTKGFLAKLVSELMDIIRIQNVFELHRSSDQRLVIFPGNRNMNRFAEPTSVRIGIGIVSEFQKLQIGLGIKFVR